MINGTSILIVDDEKNTCEGLKRYLSSYEYDVHAVASGEAALEYLSHTVPDIVLTDLKMGSGIDGLVLLQEVKKRSLPTIVIMMTAYGTVENAVDAMQKGAYHYLPKPVNLDELLIVVKNAVSQKRLENENQDLKERLYQSVSSDMIIGTSRSFKKVYDEALQVALSNASVMLQGESGTGKELVAHLIHQNSSRRDYPFIPVHCAALSEHLLESELFGHEKGSFTGATERKIGRFEKANRGTIFLDEIAEIDHKTQVKLLRVLQDGEFERVGGTKTIRSDCRLIAATNKDLSEEVKKGNFREDLFYRINVIVLTVPPLRDRREDIKEIFDHYVAKFSRENRKAVKAIEPAVYDRLLYYNWPGNIRELRNVAERILVLLKGETITVNDLPHDIRGEGAAEAGKSLKVDISIGGTISQLEKEAIRQKLVETEGNKTNTAKALGISRRTLYRKIEEYGI
jgi:DNA-binding NtrC family response regulator